jgi:hypothetical protein
MADVNKFSDGLIDAANRFADVVDAMQGKGARSGSISARWLLLPAAGAAAYAVATSTSKTARQARRVMKLAKDRATDLPDADLFARVKDVTGLTEERPSATNGRTRSTNSRAQGQKRRTRKAPRRKTASSSA